MPRLDKTSHEAQQPPVPYPRDKRWMWLVAWWVSFPLALALWWLIMYSPPLFDGMDWKQEFQLWAYNNLLHGALFWWWLLLTATGALLAVLEMSSDRHYDRWYSHKAPVPTWAKLWAGLMVGVLIFSMIGGGIAIFNHDKRVGDFYGRATTFFVPDVNVPPQVVSALVNHSAPFNGSSCERDGLADVYACIKQGELPTTGWEARTGSLEGAKIALRRSSSVTGGVSLNEDTVTYLNGADGQTAGWSGIMDGSNISQPMGGVAEWSGSGNPTECLFRGPYGIDRAFAGGKLNNLPNLLAETYPWLTYQMGDVWGYCKGDEPIVVIPVTTPIPWQHETVDTAAGVILVRGNHGRTDLTYQPDVAPGVLPGPVYPASLTATQRIANQWAAGRGIRNNTNFGFVPTDTEAQAGNSSEYLLKDKVTGRLVYVTPLKPASSTSDVFTAYAVSYADEVHSGQLNAISIYILKDGDPRRFNVDNLDAQAKNYISQVNGTFVPNGGRLVEFTPVDGDIFRAFAELNGRVIYRLDISASNRIAPQLVQVENVDGSQPVPDAPGGSVTTSIATACGSDPATMTDGQLAACLQALANELAKRAGGH